MINSHYKFDKKEALFIGPNYMGIYKDIILGLQSIGYSVDFIPQEQRKDDPYYISLKYNDKKTESVFLSEMEQRWNSLLNSNEFKKEYDLLFVLDGMALHPCIFEILMQRNPNIKKINYLFDTVRGVYRFDKYFHFYDRVATFDREEAKLFDLDFLPIFFVNTPVSKTSQIYSVFGCGAYNEDRYKLYKCVKSVVDKHGMSSFIKLYLKKRKLYHLKYIVHKLLGSKYIPFEVYHSNLIIHEPLSADIFRNLMNSASVIVDTSAPHQDGLTARFMWALGAGKKIITNNITVQDYDFYTRNQILVVDINKIDVNDIIIFLKTNFEVPINVKHLISRYRIDNWLNYLLRD